MRSAVCRDHDLIVPVVVSMATWCSAVGAASTSASVVDQFETEIRIAVLQRCASHERRFIGKHPAMTSRVVSSSSPNLTSTWLSTTSLSTWADGMPSMPFGESPGVRTAVLARGGRQSECAVDVAPTRCGLSSPGSQQGRVTATGVDVAGLLAGYEARRPRRRAGPPTL
jgi:hypothetical protein